MSISSDILFIVVSGYLLGSLTLWSNSLGRGKLYNLYMRPNISPAAAGPAAPAAAALRPWVI